MKTKSQARIIYETITHYNLLNRGTNGCFCVILNKEGNSCAIGRCMISGQKVLNDIGPYLTYKNTPLGVLENILQPEYRGHPEHFWYRLRRLHDNVEIWDREGLSPRGATKVKNILIYLNLSLEGQELWDFMKLKCFEMMYLPTTEAMYYEMLNVLPPARQCGSAFAVGEESHSGMHACFIEKYNKYFAKYMTLKRFDTIYENK